MQLVRSILDRLDTIPWLQRCGIAEPVQVPFDICQVESWPEVVASYTEEWAEMQQKRLSDLTRALARDHRDLYDRWWNELVRPVREELKARMPPQVAETFRVNGMSPFLLHVAESDITRAVVETSWAAARCKVPSFFRNLFTVYEAGHFPCGWDGGEYPNGFLVYY
jgi:hypothetical protein